MINSHFLNLRYVQNKYKYLLELPGTSKLYLLNNCTATLVILTVLPYIG